MGETGTKAAKSLEKLARAANRRKDALQKLRSGRPSAVSERHLRKLLKQAQRRRRKLEGEFGRHSAKKAEEAAAGPQA